MSEIYDLVRTEVENRLRYNFNPENFETAYRAVVSSSDVSISVEVQGSERLVRAVHNDIMRLATEVMNHMRYLHS